MKKTLSIIVGLGIISSSVYVVLKNNEETVVSELTRTIICPSPWDANWANPENSNIENARTVYYVSSSSGNDNNDGLSTTSPWMTLERVSDTMLLPGDAVLFKRGDLWNETLNPPSSGESGRPILFGAYGDENERPIIENTRFRQDVAVAITGKNYLTFNNLDIRNAKYGILILNSDFLIFDHMSIGFGVDDAGIVINEGSDNGIIRYSLIDGGTEHESERDMINFQDGSAWDIHHNLVANMGHDGINLLGTIPIWHEAEAHVTKNTIHHNEFYNKLGYGRAFSTQGDGEGYASFNKFYDNYIHNTQVSIQLQGDHNEVFRNVITDVRKSPQRGDDEVFQAAGISIQDYIYAANNKVYDNIIAYTDGPGIWVGSRETGNEIKNNFIYNAGEYRGTLTSLYDIGLYIADPTVKWNTKSGAQLYEGNRVFSEQGDRTVIYRGIHYATPSPTPITVTAFNEHDGENGDRIAKNDNQKFFLTNDCKPYIENE